MAICDFAHKWKDELRKVNVGDTCIRGILSSSLIYGKGECG